MKIDIPTLDGVLVLDALPGRPLVFLGPNGTGKSRLGIFIDDETENSHRIGAQRSLELPNEVLTENYERAISLLRRNKSDSRRVSASPGSMEYNYDEVLVALFAERLRALERAHEKSEGRKSSIRPATLIDQLQALWRELVPNQSLHFSEATVRARKDGANAEFYDASEMSDGERLVLYILGQLLLVEQDGLLIIDEPELHMNRALLVRLWDLVERSRPDCAFIYITHDVDFATSRRNAGLYAVLDYNPPTFKEVLVRTRTKIVADTPPQWEVVALPPTTELPRDVLVRIVGSRKPILFVEGERGGLDEMIYRAVYKGFTVIPAGSCGQVIQLVRGFRHQEELHWLHCAGLVDLDNRSRDDDGRVGNGIYALPVQEVENLLLMPEVYLALALALNLEREDAERRFQKLKENVAASASKQADRVSLKYTSSRIWESGRSIGVRATNIAELTEMYVQMTAQTDPAAIFAEFKAEFLAAADQGDYEKLLVLYDSKDWLLNALGNALELQGRKALENLVTRLLSSQAGDSLIEALASRLPEIEALEVA